MSTARIDHANSAALHQAVVARIADALRQAVRERGGAVLAVSGGKSPVPMFEALSAIDLPWPRVTVTLVDERLLPVDHDGSNEKLVKTHLLQHAAADASFCGLRGTAATLDEAADEADRAVAKLTHPYDVIVLGMGENGHTLSWEPGGDHLDQAIDLATNRLVLPMIAEVASVTPERLTLTLPLVAKGRLVLLPLEGAGKLDTLARAMRPGPVTEMPIRAAFEHAAVEIHTAG